eukprot:GCRY01009818.1.p2 GENE.GCRY01009818.1~~GCRY01009818.1.p2  ORF type:complete len:115 (-),score=18.88 GCRY01009818.1:656-1000(-)
MTDECNEVENIFQMLNEASDAEEVLLSMLCEGGINGVDKEFLILSEMVDNENKWSDDMFEGSFSLEDLPQPCIDLFLLEKEEVVLLACTFFPEVIKTPRRRYVIPRVEAMCLVL